MECLLTSAFGAAVATGEGDGKRAGGSGLRGLSDSRASRRNIRLTASMLLPFKSGRGRSKISAEFLQSRPYPDGWSFFALAGTLPPNQPEPPVHRKRNRRTDHAGHNQKQQAEAEYRIGKVQRANCAADPNTQGPRDQADAPHVQLEASSGEVAGCVFGLDGTASGGNTNYIFTQYYIFAEAICNGTGAPKGDLSGCVRPGVDQPPVVQRRTWEALANSGAFPLVK